VLTCLWRNGKALLSKNMEIPIPGANLIKDTLWVVPSIHHCLNDILSSFGPEPNRSLVCLSAGIAFHIQLHQLHYRPAPRPCLETLKGVTASAVPQIPTFGIPNFVAPAQQIQLALPLNF
jgi:hypothetical protein